MNIDLNTQKSTNTPYSSNGSNRLSSSLENALVGKTIQNEMIKQRPVDEISRLKDQLHQQELKFKEALEKVIKENEILKSSAGETFLAAQWRQRYEVSSREKDELAEKLKVFSKFTSDINEDGVSIENAYFELQEEYRVINHLSILS